MYYYVYDEFVQDPKLERELAQIESRLTDLGISGKVARLAIFRDATELVRDEVRKGAKNIIAVGNDLTLRKVIDASAESGVAIGIIPIGKSDNLIASLLGIPQGVAACDVVAARIIEEIDTGVVNGRRFINRFSCVAHKSVRIFVEDGFSLSPVAGAQIDVRNLALAEDGVRAANPTDGQLEIVIRVPERSWFGQKKMHTSIIPVKRAKIVFEEKASVAIDGEVFEADELEIGVIERSVKLITGRARKY